MRKITWGIILMAIISITVSADPINASCITKVNGAEVTLAWDYVLPTTISGFKIFLSNTPGVYDMDPTKAFATIAPTQLEAGPFTMPVGVHYFIVVAYDGDILSDPSNEVCAQIVVKPAAPTGCSIR